MILENIPIKEIVSRSIQSMRESDESLRVKRRESGSSQLARIARGRLGIAVQVKSTTAETSWKIMNEIFEF